MSRNIVAGALAIIVFPLLASGAWAQMPYTNVGSVYLGVSAGATIAQHQNSSISGIDNGSFDTSFETDSAFTAFFGYQLTIPFAIEAEAAYVPVDMTAVSGTINGSAVSGGGHLRNILGFGNVLWKPLGASGFSPYIGAGAGAAIVDEKFNLIGATPVSSNKTVTRPAAQLIAGLDFPVSTHVSLGARYHFVWVNSGSSSTSTGDTVKSDFFTAHIVTVTGTLHF